MAKIEPGDLIGDWVVERQLGEGAMGSVFLCHSTSDPGTPVAVKMLGPESAVERAEERFQREAELLAQLEHPGIARFLDYRDEPRLLVMEFVDGPSLQAHVRGGQALAIGDALHIVHQVAETLAYLHQRGVWHRDVKPSNILVDAQGKARLVDFGIALESGSARLTTHGFFMGSLPYVPPESLKEDDETKPAAWDVYSLGVVLFELVTGTLAFADHKSIRNAGHVLADKADKPFLDPGNRYPEDIRGLIQDATAADPQWRIPEPAALIARLEEVRPRYSRQGVPELATSETGLPAIEREVEATRPVEQTPPRQPTRDPEATAPLPSRPPRPQQTLRRAANDIPPPPQAAAATAAATEPTTIKLVLAFVGGSVVMLLLLGLVAAILTRLT